MLNYFCDFFVTATVVKSDLGSYVDGIWTPAAPDEEEEIEISIIPPQPVSGDMLEMLPEGERVHEYAVTWTEYTPSLWSDSVAPDVIELDSEQFKIITVFDRQYDGQYCKLLLHRIMPDLAEPVEDPEDPEPEPEPEP